MQATEQQSEAEPLLLTIDDAVKRFGFSRKFLTKAMRRRYGHRLPYVGKGGWKRLEIQSLKKWATEEAMLNAN